MLVPKLRFKREDGTDYPEWTKQKLSAVSSRVTRKNKGNITDIPLTIASLYGLVDQREYFKKKIASRNMEGYYLLHNGEFAYNKSYSKGFDFGAIKRLDKYNCGALSTLYICFAVNSKVDSNFMTHYFDSQKWNKEVSIRCAEGARNHGLLNISTDNFFDIDMFLPTDLEEQQKIADFLSNVDEVIAQSEAEVANLQHQKKAAMQKIFSQEVRFKREDGTSYPEWEDWVLDSIGSFYGGLSGKTKEDFGKGNSKFVTYMNVYKNIFAMQEMLESVDISDNEKQNKVKYGDLLMTQSSETVEELGMSSVYLFYDEPYLNSFCFGLHLYNHALTYPMYIGYLMRSEAIRKQIMREGQGISRINLSPNRMKGMILSLPCLEEQQKIADFLATYDEAISCAKQELDKWKELKKGLLQQMFA